MLFPEHPQMFIYTHSLCDRQEFNNCQWKTYFNQTLQNNETKIILLHFICNRYFLSVLKHIVVISGQMRHPHSKGMRFYLSLKFHDLWLVDSLWRQDFFFCFKRHPFWLKRNKIKNSGSQATNKIDFWLPVCINTQLEWGSSGLPLAVDRLKLL